LKSVAIGAVRGETFGASVADSCNNLLRSLQWLTVAAIRCIIIWASIANFRNNFLRGKRVLCDRWQAHEDGKASNHSN